MPHNPIRVVVGPANYFSHPGSFNHLHDFFTDEQLLKKYIVIAMCCRFKEKSKMAHN